MFSKRHLEIDRIGPHSFVEADLGIEGKKQIQADDENWSWYVFKRCHQTNPKQKFIAFELEDQILNWFRSIETGKRILLLHGRTGVGKTTLIRYFFSCYLKRVDKERHNNTYCFRIAMPVIARGQMRAEDDFDHNVNQHLLDTFGENGVVNLTDPKSVFEMGCLAYPGNEKHRQELIKNYPPDDPAGQLKWIRSVAMSRNEDPQSVSGWADFNRLAIAHICKEKPNIQIVIFLDNVDHLSSEQQVAVWLMARHKLHWLRELKNLCFIIPIRSYLLQNSRKEDALSAYRDKLQVIAVTAPSLYDVLRARKSCDFDPVIPNRVPNDMDPSHIRFFSTYKYTVPMFCANQLLEEVLRCFDEVSTNSFAMDLCNHDLRQGIEAAKHILESPFYPWEAWLELIRKQFDHGKDSRTYGNEFINRDRMIDAIIRQKNILCEPKLRFFDNVFSMGLDQGDDHFSSSLCKLFILHMCNVRKHDVDEVVSKLMEFGHPRTLVETAITQLLECNIVVSNQGINLKEDGISGIGSCDTTLCRFYVKELIPRLDYLQGAAYLTPLDDEHYTKFVRCNPDSSVDKMFGSRTLNALLIVDQVFSDLERQWEFVQLNEVSKKYWEFYTNYKLDAFFNNWLRGIANDVRAVKETTGYLSTYVDWGLLEREIGNVKARTAERIMNVLRDKSS
jgi:hypothetical protein